MRNPLTPELERAAQLMSAERGRVSQQQWEDATIEERRFLSAQAVQSRAGDPFDSADAGTALEFFNAMSPEERSLGAWYEAGAAYMRKDEHEASQWMNSLSPGPERDAAATALVEKLTAPGAEQDGGAAFAWAASMSGAVERARYIKEAARVWALHDAAAARAAVAAAGLPEAETTALLQQLPQGGAR